MTTTRPALAIIALIIGLLLLIGVGLVVAGLVINHRARQGQPGTGSSPTMHTPVPAPFPVFRPATEPRPVGRHHEDTVRRVPADWMPVTGAARSRALEDTHLDLHKPGGLA